MNKLEVRVSSSSNGDLGRRMLGKQLKILGIMAFCIDMKLDHSVLLELVHLYADIGDDDSELVLLSWLEIKCWVCHQNKECAMITGAVDAVSKSVLHLGKGEEESSEVGGIVWGGRGSMGWER